jgi:hypothetical protein
MSENTEGRARRKIEVPPEAICPRCKKSNREADCACYSSGEFWDMQRQLRSLESERNALLGHSDNAMARIADLEEAVRRAADYLTSAADVIADGPDHDEEDERLAREFIEELRTLAPARGDEP